MLSLSSPSCLLKGVLSNHSQTLGGDSVAVDKIVVVEDGAEDTFGQQVMHQHLINGRITQVGIEPDTADSREVRKCREKSLILLTFYIDDLPQIVRQFG